MIFQDSNETEASLHLLQWQMWRKLRGFTIEDELAFICSAVATYIHVLVQIAEESVAMVVLRIYSQDLQDIIRFFLLLPGNPSAPP